MLQEWEKYKSILTYFVSFQASDLFTSEGSDKDLIFKDSAKKLVRLPPNTDSFLYLGAVYTSIVRSLKKGTENTVKHTYKPSAQPQAHDYVFTLLSRADHRSILCH